ncbi:MAG: hypothetical protein WAT52_09235 [Chitinophagales bacterium]
MLISGFTMAKNVSKLYYPIKASIMSVLPIVDEFIVALGDCDADDTARKEIESIGSEKIKIIDTVWDIEKYPNGMENAHQTDIAKNHCKGTWCLYVQADEVIHEQYLETIKSNCEKFKSDLEVEGFLFNYIHFWGDYNHHQLAHGWYKNEIRLVRNHPDIHSWQSAQSFRRIPNFDGLHYRQHADTYKLKVIKIPAYIYHYGWVRPPHYMQKKKKALDTIHKGDTKAGEMYNTRALEFDYGALGNVPKFKGTHPKVMQEKIAQFDWAEELNYSKKQTNPNAEKMKHDKLKTKFITFVEQHILGGKEIFASKNYVLLKR